MHALIQKTMSFFNWQRVPAGAIDFRSQVKETRFLLLYAVFYIIAGYVIAWMILLFPLPILGATQFVQDAWYALLFKIGLLLLVPGIIYFTVWKYRLKDLLLGLKPTGKNIAETILFVALGFLINAGHLKGLSEKISLFDDVPIRMMMGILMPLFIAAIPEELFFRGYLQTRLEKKWNRLSAIMVTNLLFAAWHLPSRYLLSAGAEGQAGDWGQVILHTGLPVFIVGVIFSVHWSRARNIVLLVLTHWAIDILPSLSAYFQIRY